MIIVMLLWFAVGLLFGAFIGVYAMMVFGNSDINERVNALRKTRIQLQIFKCYLIIRKILHMQNGKIVDGAVDKYMKMLEQAEKDMELEDAKV